MSSKGGATWMGSDATISGDASVAWDKDSARAREREKRNIEGESSGALISLGCRGTHNQLIRVDTLWVGCARCHWWKSDTVWEDSVCVCVEGAKLNT